MGQAGSKVIEQEQSVPQARQRPTEQTSALPNGSLVVSSCGSTKYRRESSNSKGITKTAKQHHGSVRTLPRSVTGRLISNQGKELPSSLISSAVYPLLVDSAASSDTPQGQATFQETRDLEAPAVPPSGGADIALHSRVSERPADCAPIEQRIAKNLGLERSTSMSPSTTIADIQTPGLAPEETPRVEHVPKHEGVFDSKTRKALSKLSKQLTGLAEQAPDGWGIALEVPMSHAEREQNRRNIELANTPLREVQLPETGSHPGEVWSSRPLRRLLRSTVEVDDEVNFVTKRPRPKPHIVHRSLKRLREATLLSPGPRRKKFRTEADGQLPISARWRSRQRKMTGLWKGWDSMIAGKRELESLEQPVAAEHPSSTLYL